MSRKRYRLRAEIEERWPTLYQFLACYCHQDWTYHYGSFEEAIEAAISDYPLDARQRVLKEWRDCNVIAMTGDDIRSTLQDGFGVNVYFTTPIDARNFWNTVYDKLIVSVRDEVGERWKP